MKVIKLRPERGDGVLTEDMKYTVESVHRLADGSGWEVSCRERKNFIVEDNIDKNNWKAVREVAGLESYFDTQHLMALM